MAILGDLLINLRRRYFAITSSQNDGSARTDQNFASVNEHAMLDGVVYFFSFEFTKLLTLFKEQSFFFFCGEHVPYTAQTTFFLKISEKE